MTTYTIQAADDASLASLLVAVGAFKNTETGPRAKPGIEYSYIGRASLDNTPAVMLPNRYGLLRVSPNVFGDAEAANLASNLKSYEYTGNTLRMWGGDGVYDASGVPFSVSMRQARLVLLGSGMLAHIEAALDAIPNEVERQAAKITWEFSGEVQRQNGLVEQLAPLLGLTAQQIDAMFLAARDL